MKIFVHNSRFQEKRGKRGFQPKKRPKRGLFRRKEEKEEKEAEWEASRSVYFTELKLFEELISLKRTI